MSSFFARSSTVKTPNVDYKVEGDWIDIWESKNPHLPPFTDLLRLTYSATCREPLIFVPTKKSNTDALKDVHSMNLLKWHDTGQEKVRIFAGKELYWSNQVRKMALLEGVENHLPKILYLIRPETA